MSEVAESPGAAKSNGDEPPLEQGRGGGSDPLKPTKPFLTRSEAFRQLKERYNAQY